MLKSVAPAIVTGTVTERLNSCLDDELIVGLPKGKPIPADMSQADMYPSIVAPWMNRNLCGKLRQGYVVAEKKDVSFPFASGASADCPDGLLMQAYQCGECKGQNDAATITCAKVVKAQ